MSVYKLAGTGTGGTQNGLAQLDVQFDGIITAISGTLVATLNAGADQAIAEASFLSVNTIGTNDTRGSLFEIAMRLLVLSATSGVPMHTNNGIGGLAIAVNAGERLWGHVVATAGKSSQFAFHIFVEDGQGVPVANRRR